MKMFKTEIGYNQKPTITEVEVVKCTEHFVTLPKCPNFRERRESIASCYYQYHNSWEAALEYFQKYANSSIDRAQNRLTSALQFQITVNALKNPSPLS